MTIFLNKRGHHRCLCNLQALHTAAVETVNCFSKL